MGNYRKVIALHIKNGGTISECKKKRNICSRPRRKIDSSVEGGIRPVLVLQNDKGNEHSTTVIIAPITSKLTKHRIPTHVLLKNPALERISIIMLEQIQTIDQSQLIEYMGEATVQEMNRIERASRISLGMQGVKRYE